MTKNKKNTVSFLATRSIASGSKKSPEKLNEQWRSRIKYNLANLEDTKHIILEDFLSYFLENENGWQMHVEASALAPFRNEEK